MDHLMNKAPQSFSEIEAVMGMHWFGGKHARIKFPNGYVASIIMTSFSYGSAEAPYELAVLKNGHLCYDTPVTNDVIGSLTEAEVVSICSQIFNLPAQENA